MRRLSLPLLALAPAALFLTTFLLFPLRFPPAARPAFYADDFFYYLVIAQNLVAHGMSSFDGHTLTNGYHPLWMLMLAALVFLTNGTGKIFFTVLLFLQLAASIFSVWLVFRILVRWRTPTLLIIASTLIFAVALSDIAVTGMEVVIAVPLILAFVAEADTAATQTIRPLRLGLLASACILARVDTVILTGMVALALIPTLLPVTRRRRALALLALGLTPAGVYFISNVVLFGTALPISSSAKALTPGLIFNTTALLTAFTPGDFDPVEIMVIMLPAWCVLACAATGVMQWHRHSARERLRTVLCAFPPLFYLLLAVRSDWMLWRWYLYPIVTATPFALAWAGGILFRVQRQAAIVVTAAAAILFGLAPATLDLAGHYAHTTPNVNSIYTAAVAMQPFAAAHPGQYAMGDRAGTMAFLINQPVFQLEGIVGDRPMLAAIKARTNLLELLQAHHVDYYIGTKMTQNGNCWLGREPKPHQAGTLSPAMTGRFCGNPMFSFTDREGITTQVFALGQRPGALPLDPAGVRDPGPPFIR
jgi:hypothetical protein